MKEKILSKSRGTHSYADYWVVVNDVEGITRSEELIFFNEGDNPYQILQEKFDGKVLRRMNPRTFEVCFEVLRYPVVRAKSASEAKTAAMEHEDGVLIHYNLFPLSHWGVTGECTLIDDAWIMDPFTHNYEDLVLLRYDPIKVDSIKKRRLRVKKAAEEPVSLEDEFYQRMKQARSRD